MNKKISLIGAGQIGGTLAHLIGVKELVNGLYEIEGYDYLTISKVNKRIRENTYNGKFLDLKNGIR